LPPSIGCQADVGAEVIGRKDCVMYVGKFEKILADRSYGMRNMEWGLQRDNAGYFSISLSHSVTLKVKALCF
jgi:hypothetical protein